MAKKQEDTEIEIFTPVTKTLISVNTSKVYSFEQWARIRNKPDRHLNGLRAHLGTEASSKFSLELWDSKFQNY